MLVGVDSKNRISIPDYAIALVDELEILRHIRQRFTVGNSDILTATKEPDLFLYLAFGVAM